MLKKYGSPELESLGEKRKRQRSFGWWKLILLAGILALLPRAYSGWSFLSSFFFENEPPQITLLETPAGVGLEPAALHFKVSDARAGVDEVVVRVEQQNRVVDLFKQHYADKEVITQVEINGKKVGLDAGEAQLSILAFDKSFWSNRQVLNLSFTVDYTKPRIEPISVEHNVAQGGVQLVFYRVSEQSTNVFSGVKAGSRLFPGFHADQLDNDFKGHNDLYFAFFAVPLDLDPSRDSLRLFARDAVGNTNSASFPHAVQQKSYPQRQIKVSQSFAEMKVNEIWPQFVELSEKLRGVKIEDSPSLNDLEQLAKSFRRLNVDFRALIEEELHKLFARPKSHKFWEGKFGRLAGSAQQTPFGEKRNYDLLGIDVGETIHEGVDLASTPHAAVAAAAGGIVIYAGELGLYGQGVIIDHGFGLNTLYGHLSAIAVTEGDRVDNRTEIGRSGATGLADGDHLHFEIRLYQTPVRPVEWWDPGWIDTHITKKISMVKKQLGIAETTPIEPKF